MNQQLEQNRVLTESFKGGVIMDVTNAKKQKLHKSGRCCCYGIGTRTFRY